MAPARTLALSTTLLALGACAPAYQRLASVEDVPELYRLEVAFEQAPSTLHRYPTRIDDGPVVHVALRETGRLSGDSALVMIHGCMSDHRSWRFLCGALADDYRLLLVDLVGCGDSDRPDPELLGQGGYSPQAMAERVLQALDAHMAGGDAPESLTIVAHSLGGMVAFRMFGSDAFAERYGQVLARVDRAVLLSPADFSILNPPPGLERIARLSHNEVTFAHAAGILRNEASKATLRSVCDPMRAFQVHADQYVSIIRDPATRRAQQAILVEALPRCGEQPDWATIQRYNEEYRRVDVPCLIIWGAEDEIIPVATGYKLADQLPQARLETVHDCKHSIHTERPELCADLILQFIEAGREAERVEGLAGELVLAP